MTIIETIFAVSFVLWTVAILLWLRNIIDYL